MKSGRRWSLLVLLYMALSYALAQAPLSSGVFGIGAPAPLEMALLIAAWLLRLVLLLVMPVALTAKLTRAVLARVLHKLTSRG